MHGTSVARNFVVLVAIAAWLVGVGCASRPASEPRATVIERTEAEPARQSPADAPTAAPQTSAQIAPPSDAFEVTVDWVNDGDSFDADGPDGFVEIRLLGVNAAEGTECFGDEAKDVLIDRIGREQVLVSGERYDQFGRLLAWVWHDGELLNLRLVSEGLAVARSAFGHEYESTFEDAEATARDLGLGLWAPDACGPPVDVAVAIIDLNPDAEGRDNENPNGEWIEIYNAELVPVDLTGWGVRDESTRHRFTFPDGFMLAADATVLIRSGCGDDTATELFWCDPDGPIWSNSGDTAFLTAPSGSSVDVWAYGSVYDG